MILNLKKNPKFVLKISNATKNPEKTRYFISYTCRSEDPNVF